MEDSGSVSLRICLDGHANSLALNKENTCIAVAGRSRKQLFVLKTQFQFHVSYNFSAESAKHRQRWLRGGSQHASATRKQQKSQLDVQFQRNFVVAHRREHSGDISNKRRCVYLGYQQVREKQTAECLPRSRQNNALGDVPSNRPNSASLRLARLDLKTL